jgi:hypothetical protein
MPPLTYHAGQLAIQEEAKTTHIAERLAHWIGPVADFSREADLLLFAMMHDDGAPHFSALSGKAPLIEIINQATTGLRHQPGSTPQGKLLLHFNPDLAPRVSAPTPCGGLAINFANARRARINGLLQPTQLGSELITAETFTLCRKYISPSLSLSSTPTFGPLACEEIALDDPWLTSLVAQSETMFLASISPAGGPDVAHRGGPEGFLQLDATARKLTWNEYVGDGVFKSAGNIRATGRMTALIPDLASGDGVELVGLATYHNIRSGRQQRVSPLEQHHEDFPVQGVMTCEIQRAIRLHQLMVLRQPIDSTRKITSCATVEKQAPQ